MELKHPEVKPKIIAVSGGWAGTLPELIPTVLCLGGRPDSYETIRTTHFVVERPGGTR